MPLKLMYITNRPRTALTAQSCGVDRIWVDLETRGKAARQGGMDTVQSRHTVEDVRALAPLLHTSELMVRINPWWEGSEAEVEAVLEAGAQRIMLPMWKTPDEVRRFLNAVGGRAAATLLLETREAEACLDRVLCLPGLDEIHIGLNDLHLAYGQVFMFELLANGTVERICGQIRAAGLPYGFGGIARLGRGDLPAERILPEHYRLGSTRVILSRSFCGEQTAADQPGTFRLELEKLRQYEAAFPRTEEAFQENAREVRRLVSEIVKRKRAAECGRIEAVYERESK